MSVRSEKPTLVEPGTELANAAAATDAPLGEGNSFAVASPDHPLKRHIVVSIKASLNELCLQKQRGTWAPSQEALRSIFQQRKFTSLDGAAEPMGGKSSPQAASVASPTRQPAIQTAPARLLSSSTQPGCRRTARVRVRRQTSRALSSTT